ncbi:MAG: AAA-like domain-containing protein [Lachnospiraceae bacterium]|nr:AAA-like domain-containing protein [Lachnospiraceae bacterium]
MAKIFNVTGACRPDKHYMVDLKSRLAAIREMVDEGDYFTINRARQYGKTTTLRALADYLRPDYIVVSMDFQRMSSSVFETENRFCVAFAKEFLKKIRIENELQEGIILSLKTMLEQRYEKLQLFDLFDSLSEICEKADRPIVLMIDEADQAANNQIFLDFLSQLRAGYLDRDMIPTFQSVILAGVYDIRSIKKKIRPTEEHKENSLWNITADFRVDMSFSAEDISGMLNAYEADYCTGMHVSQMAGLIYDYTSGYPYLVSRLCKLMDEYLFDGKEFINKAAVWSKGGFQRAVKILLEENNPLFDSLINKLYDFPEMNAVISSILFQGEQVSYNADDRAIRDAIMFGFIKVQDSALRISNRIFETRLYNKFLLDARQKENKIFAEGSRHKDQYIVDGHLNVRHILERFVDTFDFLYGDKDETFVEDEGRRYFMLFLKPIINGSGNCYVEAETRNRERMDLVIDYHGEQFICELKIWHGNAYNERGEQQLTDYMDYFHLKKGYMLSFNFNKKKETGVKEIVIEDRVLIEAVV